MNARQAAVIFLLIISPILIPIILIIGFHIIDFIIIPFLIVIYFYDIIYISLLSSLLSFIISFIGFRYFLNFINSFKSPYLFLLKKFPFIINMILSVSIAFNVAMYGGRYEAEQFIDKQALLQLNKKPSYTHICLKGLFQFCPLRCENICFNPHSLVEKDNKCYFWSFRYRKFLSLPESICRNVRW